MKYDIIIHDVIIYKSKKYILYFASFEIISQIASSR